MNNNKLKIYTDLSLIPQDLVHTFMLIPFLGKYNEDPNDPDNGRFDEFELKGKDYIEIEAKPENADYFLLPFGYSFKKEHQIVILNFLEIAKKYNKTTLLFYNADDDSPINHPQTIIYRTSLNSSTRNKNVFSLPGWSVDFFKYSQQIIDKELCNKIKPSVSYCGYATIYNDTTIQKIKNTIKILLKKQVLNNEMEAKKLRGKCCSILMNNNAIQTNFIFRDSFWASEVKDKNQARLEYVNNMLLSTYSLVARGGGNFSYRFYEVLSLGRIPVFINTDSVLPFENLIDWKKQLIWIEKTDIKNIDKHLLSFHTNKTANEIIAIQNSNRTLYETFLSPLGFFKTITNQLLKQ